MRKSAKSAGEKTCRNFSVLPLDESLISVKLPRWNFVENLYELLAGEI
jgi:hypothetical protein